MEKPSCVRTKLQGGLWIYRSVQQHGVPASRSRRDMSGRAIAAREPNALGRLLLAGAMSGGCLTSMSLGEHPSMTIRMQVNTGSLSERK